MSQSLDMLFASLISLSETNIPAQCCMFIILVKPPLKVNQIVDVHFGEKLAVAVVLTYKMQ